jgi:response regulator RpfG family c-di-GMP phosphodiesterase
MMNSLYFKIGALAAAFACGFWLNGTLWQSKWDAHMLEDAQANQKAAEATLTKQKNLLQELDNAYKAAEVLKEKHDRNVADSRIAAERMREQLNRIKAMPASGNTSTLAERANAATNTRVLSELLGISDYMAGKYAEEVGKHRIALQACINEHNAIR